MYASRVSKRREATWRGEGLEGWSRHLVLSPPAQTTTTGRLLTSAKPWRGVGEKCDSGRRWRGEKRATPRLACARLILPRAVIGQDDPDRPPATDHPLLLGPFDSSVSLGFAVIAALPIFAIKSRRQLRCSVSHRKISNIPLMLFWSTCPINDR